MSEFIDHKIRIGTEEFLVKLATTVGKDGNRYAESDGLIQAQRNLGIELLRNRKSAEQVSPEIFNFLVNISGLKAKEIAEYLNVDPGNISQWRREKGLSSSAWQTMRIFFLEFFCFGEIRSEIFLRNSGKFPGTVSCARITAKTQGGGPQDSEFSEPDWLPRRDEYKTANEIISRNGTVWGSGRKVA